MSEDFRQASAWLLPELEHEFSKEPNAEAVSSRPDYSAFIERFREVVPRLVASLHALYGGRWDFFRIARDAARLCARAWLERPDFLRELDRGVDAERFSRESALGMAVYADLFSDGLKGLRERVPYLAELGIDYLHVMPLFRSPDGEDDGGYTVSDYRSVDPRLGTNQDLGDLAAALRAAGISLVLDFVLNHTSDEHPWALAARQGDAEARSRYFLFRDRAEADRYDATLREIFPGHRRGCFTWCEEARAWVWTTFNSFQWDLNYGEPATFLAMAREMLAIANAGAEVLRLDALAFVWKRLGTSCENLSETHELIKAFSAIAAMVAPAVMLKSEAIVHPDEVPKYVGADQCRLSYNPLAMALIWESLATRRTDLLRYSLSRRWTLPQGCAWVNYARCHDDLGWTFSDEDAAALGIHGGDHRRFLNAFYTNRFAGSFARGLPFHENPVTGDCRVSGTLASLAGLEEAFELMRRGDGEADRLGALAVARILLIQGLVLSLGGLPLLYQGDELGTLNDYGFADEPEKAEDSRWVHRVRRDWARTREVLARAEGSRARGGSGGIVTPAEAGPDEWLLDRQAEIAAGLRRLIRVKAGIPALGESRSDFPDTGESGLLAVLRHGPRGRVLVLANFTERPLRADANLARLCGLRDPGVDLESGRAIDSMADLRLEPYALAWLANASAPAGH